jgi:hypothetical protein
MRGGHQYRGFFFIQAAQFITAYQNNLPETYPTPEESEAGLSDLSKDFGFSALLFRVSREMHINPVEFCNEWSARDFYHLCSFLTWEAKCQRDYHELIATKNKPK